MKIVGWFDEGLLIKDSFGYFFERLRGTVKQKSLENYLSAEQAEEALKKGEVEFK